MSGEGAVIAKLIQDFELDDEDEKKKEKIRKVKLTEGNGSISLKAVKNIILFLREGFPEFEAVRLGGIRNAFRETVNKQEGKVEDHWAELTSEEIGNLKDQVREISRGDYKEGQVIDEIERILLEEYERFFPKGSKVRERLYHHSQETVVKSKAKKLDLPKNLRNPIVQQAIHELRRLVNELLQQPEFVNSNGRFDEIRIELARELKQSRKRREEAHSNNLKNRKANEEALRQLDNYGMRRSRENIHRYLLWKELRERGGEVTDNAISPFSGDPIPLSELFGDKYQIEHIIPRSLSLDNSLMNKTLCERAINKQKGNKTPYQFYIEQKGEERWKEIKEQAFRLLPYEKAKRFTSKKVPDEQDTASRFLNDTRFISTETKSFLQPVSEEKVSVSNGKLTNELREKWGLNNMIFEPKRIDKNVRQAAEDGIEGNKNYWAAYNGETREFRRLLSRIENDVPVKDDNELILTGFVQGGKFNAQRNISVPLEAASCKDGKHWAKFNVNPNPVYFHQVFNPFPEKAEDEIVLIGEVKKGKLESKLLTKKLDVGSDVEDGKYYLRCKVVFNSKDFISVENRKPKPKEARVLLYANVQDEVFESKLFKTDANGIEGKHWLLLTPDESTFELFPLKRLFPEIKEGQVIVSGNVVEKEGERRWVSYEDISHELPLNGEVQENGRHLAVFERRGAVEFFPHLNELPKVEDGEILLQGKVLAMNFGNIGGEEGSFKYFLPDKSRSDHRHHAIDALAVALSDQASYQELSTLYAKNDNRKRGLPEDRYEFEQPWDGFHKEAKEKVEGLIIKHRKNDEITKKVIKKVKMNGRTWKSQGLAVRGQLHKENVYGKHRLPNTVDDEKYFRKKDLTDLSTRALIDKIVDKGVREVILQRVEKLGGFKGTKKDKLPDGVYFTYDKSTKKKEWQIFLPNRKGGDPVPVFKTRIGEIINGARALSEANNRYVNPRNNHHILVYFKEPGEMDYDPVQFWEVVHRQLNSESVYEYDKGVEFREVFEKEDYFLLNLDRETYELHKEDNKFLSKYLYKVQKIGGNKPLSEGDKGYLEICFRKHLDARPDKEAKCDYRYVKGFGDGKTGYEELRPIKVFVDELGQIKEFKRKKEW